MHGKELVELTGGNETEFLRIMNKLITSNYIECDPDPRAGIGGVYNLRITSDGLNFLNKSLILFASSSLKFAASICFA